MAKVGEGAMQINLSTFGKIHLTIDYQKLALGGVSVYELDIPLAFARKAPHFDEACFGTVQRVFFQDRFEMTTYDFDQFEKSGFPLTAAMTVNFAIPFDDSKACMMITAPYRPILFIAAEGYKYGRYVARLG